MKSPEHNLVVWRERADRRAWCEAREGAALLRTNLTEADPAQLWAQYVQLTEAEAAFRALKSELAIRPIWHQKASRVQAHILVAFLGYALWVTLKHTLKRAGSAMSPQQALHGLRGIKSGDILLERLTGVRSACAASAGQIPGNKACSISSISPCLSGSVVIRNVVETRQVPLKQIKELQTSHELYA